MSRLLPYSRLRLPVFLAAFLGAACCAPDTFISRAGAQQATFSSTWETGTTGPSRFLGVHSAGPDRFVRSTAAPRLGAYSARVTVRPGDTLYGGDRSEALIMTTPAGARIDEAAASGTQLYAISIRLDAGWQNPNGTSSGLPATCSVPYSWGVVFQLHGPDAYGASPAFGLSVSDSASPGPKYTVSLNAGMLGADRNAARKVFQLSNNGLALGKWVDFIIQVRWTDAPDGKLNVWRRDVGQTAFTHVLGLANIATLQQISGSRGLAHYWKTGLYRSTGCSMTNALSIEGPARGTDWDAVRVAAFGR